MRAITLAIVLAIPLSWTCSPTSPDSSSVYFAHVEFPDTLESMTPSIIRAHVGIGPSSCWKLRAASVERRGGSLIALGTVYDAAPRGGSCAAVNVSQWLTLTMPPLPPGDYLFVAGDYADTVLVRDVTVNPPTSLMTLGYPSRLEEGNRILTWSGLRFELVNPEVLPPRCDAAYLYGTLEGPERRLRLRRVVPLPNRTAYE